MAHWYDLQGNLHAYVPNKSRGGLREATLRDARPNLWYPSVTTKLGILNKPGLNIWAMNRAVQEALTSTRYYDPNISIEDSVKMVVAKSDEYRNWAADFGTKVHDSIASLWKTEHLPEETESDELEKVLAEIVSFPGLEPYQDYTKVNDVAEATYDFMIRNGFAPIAIEQRFVSPLWGWAGTADLVATHYGEPCIVDYKTQNGTEFNYWEEWPIQLAGYDLGIFCTEEYKDSYEPMKRIEIISSRTDPGVIEMKEWDNGRRYDSVMIALAELWRLMNNYDPRPREGGFSQEKLI